MLIFRKYYFFIAIILFVIEVLIALFVHDGIIRPYIGDFLVVILIYCFARSFIKSSVLATAIFTLLFAYLVEFLQYLNLIQILGLLNNKLANVVLGNLFEWVDMIAYTLGIVLVLAIEKWRGEKLT